MDNVKLEGIIFSVCCDRPDNSVDSSLPSHSLALVAADVISVQFWLNLPGHLMFELVLPIVLLKAENGFEFAELTLVPPFVAL